MQDVWLTTLGSRGGQSRRRREKFPAIEHFAIPYRSPPPEALPSSTAVLAPMLRKRPHCALFLAKLQFDLAVHLSQRVLLLLVQRHRRAMHELRQLSEV